MKKKLSALIIFFTSCAQFEVLEIISIIPANGEYGVASDAAVRIEFSADVNRETLERNLSLKADGNPVAGTHAWESARVYRFVPHRRFANGARCVMELPRSIEDARGNAMEKDVISEFYVGSDLISPRVVSSSPPCVEGGTVGMPVDISTIEILFSEPMDTAATSSAFTISPDVAGYIIWSDDNTRMAYRLISRLEAGRQYRATVASSAKDASGNLLEKNFTLVFIAGEDFIHPEVRGAFESGTIPPPYFDIAAINRGVSRFSSISVEFSEAMDTSSVESAFSLKPATQGRFSWSSKTSVLTFIPDRAFSMNTVYTLSIASHAKDTAGLALRDNYTVLFCTDVADSLPFYVSRIEGSFDAESEPFIELYGGGALPWPLFITMGDYQTPPRAYNPNDYTMKVYFSNAAGPVSIDLYSLVDSLLIEILDGEGSPCITDIDLNDEGSAAFITFDGLINIRNPETPTPALYRFTIAGGSSGVKDGHGNSMKQSFVCEFKDSN